MIPKAEDMQNELPNSKKYNNRIQIPFTCTINRWLHRQDGMQAGRQAGRQAGIRAMRSLLNTKSGSQVHKQFYGFVHETTWPVNNFLRAAGHRPKHARLITANKLPRLSGHTFVCETTISKPLRLCIEL